MNKTYKFLSISSMIFKILSWVSLIVGIIASIVIFTGGGTPQAPKYAGIISILLGTIYLLIFFTASEAITITIRYKK